MLKRIVQPAVEPVSLLEAKLHLRVEFDNDDDLITELIKAAHEACEHQVLRSFITTTWRYSIDDFPHAIMLPIADVSAIEAVTYIDNSGTEQTIDAADYTLIQGPPAFLYPYFGTIWPSTYDQYGAITIDFTAGYGDTAADVPAAVKMAIKLVLADLYEHREESSEITLTRTSTGACWLLAASDWGGTRV